MAFAWAFTAEGECAILCLCSIPAKMLLRPFRILTTLLTAVGYIAVHRVHRERVLLAY